MTAVDEAVTGSPLLRVDAVTRRFGGLVAVNEVSLHVDPGEIVAVVGPNGAGKTTLFNLMTGQLKADEGDVWFDGRRITRLAAHRRARLGIARTFQIVRPFTSMTVVDNAAVGALMGGRSCIAARRHADGVLTRVELGRRAGVTSAELTLAQRKRLEVARAVASDPRILLLDEVMAGLNPSEIERAVQLVRGLVEEGLTVLLIEHNLRVVRSLADRVIVLDHGVRIAEGSPDAVLEDPRVVEAYLGRRR
ncbi:MAG: ABC transporter ATP-binding protein [Actinomycetia bacterium]|nr:ABC transporter ATP-binding protein [Actinomycetes bacterium]